ncbi:CDF family Co(II)/Ni(II) efflux transporter DmeF [Ideonella sp. BN130291]|uniref:CDF family Co(II)/Ni(II) efflux transporter DmeF n=1 Tax=Ideonella sp. BN130291 TaxID=3112940 RepID=UPI002E267E55|nr:CDF family Co(II)/Ni(II) efflux transporter DmeF [Ideonella sp. BN130291]
MHAADPHSHALSHDHQFHSANPAAERGTRVVMWITLATMVVEIAAGLRFNSMALLADGWHMSSHAVAIGVSAFAYAAARRLATDERFAFGTWKIEVLGGFASALFLLGVVALMVVGSVERLLSPQPIGYAEAMGVAGIGLVVNLACAFILHRAGGQSGGHAHAHPHEHAHSLGHDHAHHDAHSHHHHDLNLKSAYLHVLADAATSVLAIAALAGGWWLGWAWLDPAIGLAGALLVAVWAWGLLRQTGAVLLDREMDHPVVDEIREALQDSADPQATRITDLHVWRVGQRAYACALTLLTRDPQLTPDEVRRRLAVHEEIAHTTVEIHRVA